MDCLDPSLPYVGPKMSLGVTYARMKRHRAEKWVSLIYVHVVETLRGQWHGKKSFVRLCKFFFGTALSTTHSDNVSAKSHGITPKKFIKIIKYCSIWNFPFEILENQKKIFNLSNKLHFIREFSGTAQKELEVQLTLGCKAEKAKYHWKSALLQWHSLNSCPKRLA